MSCINQFKISSQKVLWVILHINAFSIYISIKFCVPIHSRLVNAWRNVRDAEKNFTTTFFDANEVFRYVSRSLWGLWHFNAILTNLDPFHTIEQKRHPISMAIDFIKIWFTTRDAFYYSTLVFSPFLSNDKLFCGKLTTFKGKVR